MAKNLFLLLLSIASSLARSLHSAVREKEQGITVSLLQYSSTVVRGRLEGRPTPFIETPKTTAMRTPNIHDCYSFTVSCVDSAVLAIKINRRKILRHKNVFRAKLLDGSAC